MFGWSNVRSMRTSFRHSLIPSGSSLRTHFTTRRTPDSTSVAVKTVHPKEPRPITSSNWKQTQTEQFDREVCNLPHDKTSRASD